MALKTYTLAGGEKERVVFGKGFVIAETKKGTVVQRAGVAYTLEEPFDEVVKDLEGKAPDPRADTGTGDEDPEDDPHD